MLVACSIGRAALTYWLECYDRRSQHVNLAHNLLVYPWIKVLHDPYPLLNVSLGSTANVCLRALYQRFSYGRSRPKMYFVSILPYFRRSVILAVR